MKPEATTNGVDQVLWVGERQGMHVRRDVFMNNTIRAVAGLTQDNRIST